MNEPGNKTFVAEEADAGSRLDVFLRSRIEGLGRAGAKRLSEEGLVRINGRRAPKSALLAAGDRVEVEALEHATVGVVPEEDPALAIAYEDEDLVVVDKRAGVPTQPLRPGERGTVANALLYRYPEMSGLGSDPREAGLIHRLDVGTSGLVIAARSRASHDKLTEMLRQEEIEKRYLALVRGTPETPRTIEYALAPEPGERSRMRACFSLDEVVRYDGKPAVSEVLSATPRGEFSVVEVSAKRGARHQVRAHLAAEGYPLVGDTLYGGVEHEGAHHHLLHASLVSFAHPLTGKEVRVESPLPSAWPA